MIFGELNKIAERCSVKHDVRLSRILIAILDSSLIA